MRREPEMVKIKVLIEGYAKQTEDGWLASSTTTLIEDSGKNIIVDPGINKALLLKKLEEKQLTPADIDIVFMTHYHPDHVFLAALFESAQILDGDTVYQDDKETGYQNTIPGTRIKVIPTPGHAHEHASLLVPTAKGKVVVAADLFWWTDGEKQKVRDTNVLISREDPFVKDKKALIQSRKKILKVADWIIPGHGKMFRNPERPLR